MSVPLNNNTHNHVIIVGISSHLGVKIAKQCLSKGWDVTGTYRRKNTNLNLLKQQFHEKNKELHLYELDVLVAPDISNLCEKLAHSERFTNQDITIIYCCGKWGYGDIATLVDEHFDNVIGVGLRAPFFVTANVLRYFNRGVQIILVTGLGGEKSAFASNALYSITTSGVYNLVKSVGAELASKESVCIGVALGLFDKEQEYASALSKYLNIGKLAKLDCVASFIASIMESRDRMHNGAVIELAGGLFNYQKAIDFFKTIDDK